MATDSTRHEDRQDLPPGGVAERVAVIRAIGANALTVGAMSARALFGIMTARLFGGPALGGFVLASTWIDLFSQVGVLGLDSGAMIRSARAHADRDGTSIRRIFRSALGVTAAASSALTIGLIAAAATGWLDILPGTGGLEALFIVMAISLPAFAVGRVSAQVARGLQVVRYDLYAQGIVGTAIMIATLFAGHAIGLGAVTPAVAMALGTIAGGGAAWWFTSRLVVSVDTSEPAMRRDADKGLIPLSLPIAAVQLVDVLAIRADVLLLGMFAARTAGITPLMLGIYGAAWEAAGILRKFRQVFGLALTPAAARARSGLAETATREQSGQVGRWLVAVIGPAVCVMALGSHAILSLYGSGFAAGASWLGMLAIGSGMRGVLVALDSQLIVERPALNLLNGAVAVSVQVAASVVLIPRHGPLGAAIAALMATAVRAFMLLVEFRLVKGWWWPLASLQRPAIAIALALVPGIAIRLVWTGSMGASIGAAIFLIAYLAAWRFVGLSVDDRTLIKTIRGRLP